MISIINSGSHGVTANKGSAATLIAYMEKERLAERDITPDMCQGLLFNQAIEGLSINEATNMIDLNNKGLRSSDAKFYELECCPSQPEQEAMLRGCKTDREREQVFLQYIRDVYMEDYAANFKGYVDRKTKEDKQFCAADLIYVVVIHHKRKNKEGLQWHSQIVVSRQTRPIKGEKPYSLSPCQNNRKANGKGPVKSSFSRTDFYQSLEDGFDRRYKYDRKPEEKFTYKRDIKARKAADGREYAYHKKKKQEERQSVVFLPEEKKEERDARAKADWNRLKKEAMKHVSNRAAEIAAIQASIIDFPTVKGDL